MYRLVLFLCASCAISSLFGQDIPKALLTRYYYQYTPSIASKYSLNVYDVDQFLWNSGLVFIDSATREIEAQNGYDTIANVTKSITSGAFYASVTEVSNKEYKEFFKSNPTPDMHPDTVIWPTNAIETDPYQHFYFQHEAYNKYPVLGVSYLQAVAYCAWKEIELNKALQAKGIKGYKLLVTLPTEAEWINFYYSRVQHWFGGNQGEAYPLGVTPTYLNFIYGSSGYRCNFGVVQSYRLQNLRLPQMMEYAYNLAPRPVTDGMFTTMGYCHHLLGNAAEWTSTSAEGTLFNEKEYIYTMSGKVIKNTMSMQDSNTLKKLLRNPADMKKHYAIKGGSWMDDIFYLQPAAVRFEHENYKANDVGFRYVVRVLPN